MRVARFEHIVDSAVDINCQSFVPGAGSSSSSESVRRSMSSLRLASISVFVSAALASWAKEAVIPCWCPYLFVCLFFVAHDLWRCFFE